jgi:uroporphyrinogen decarboxylase
MMTPRERMLAALNYARPDRIPVEYHPSPAGMCVHGQKLLDLFQAYPPDNPVTFALPELPASDYDPDGRYHAIKTDEWGTTWEYRIYGVHGHPYRYPFASWEATAVWKLPPVPPLDAAIIAEQRREYLPFGGWISVFEKLHALRPMDELLMDLATGEPHLMAFLERMEAYWQEVIASLIVAGVDVIIFGDDFGTQTSTLISPALFRRVYVPIYRRLVAPIKQAGRKVLFHSCGYLGGILDELFALGIDCLWPQITFLDADPGFPARCKAAGVSILVHPDRQRLIPLGTPAEIDAQVRLYTERYRNLGGGGILHIEIENDAPFENVCALVEAAERYR